MLLTTPGSEPGPKRSAWVRRTTRSTAAGLLPQQGDSATDAFRCVEMREGSPWLWQADCYGACGVVHCLLFGDYMEVDRVMDAAGVLLQSS